MQGDGAGEEVAAARARNLQPNDGPHDPQRLLGAPITPQDVRAMNGRQAKTARRLQENIDRRLADGRLVALLEQDGFTGPRYDLFVEELVRYGISVLRGWMHSGYIFDLVAQRGFNLNPHELDLGDLATDSDLREELATMTIARALPRFRQQALVDKGWTPEGGASITTYFMGACAYDFPNEFRRHRALRREKELYSPPVSTLSVAQEVLGNLSVLDELGEITDPRVQAIVALTLDGYSQDEIRELVDATTVRAVEGSLYRWRTKAKQKRKGDRDD